MEEIFRFSVNNWMPKTDKYGYYPDEEPFTTWLDYEDWDNHLLNNKWVKENKLVVVISNFDMSTAFAVCAPKEFVEFHIPCLIHKADIYKKFIFNDKDENGEYIDDYGLTYCKFKEYNEENIGLWYYDWEENEFLRYPWNSYWEEKEKLENESGEK